WIWEQYDHLVQGNTVQRPGGDAAVIRVGQNGKALALVTDCTPRYCHADPVRGGMQAVAESWRNLTAVGAVPLALTDCMNFGNPVILIGETKGHLGASLYLREIEGKEVGPPPPVDLAAERQNGDFVRAMIEEGRVAACHDVSDGGLLVALAEMAMAGGHGIAL